MTMRFELPPGENCPPIAAARRLWLSLEEFRAQLPDLMKQLRSRRHRRMLEATSVHEAFLAMKIWRKAGSLNKPNGDRYCDRDKDPSLGIRRNPSTGFAAGGVVGNSIYNMDSVVARYAGGGSIALAGGEAVTRAASVTRPRWARLTTSTRMVAFPAMTTATLSESLHRIQRTENGDC
jgi:hypothetical protein